MKSYNLDPSSCVFVYLSHGPDGDKKVEVDIINCHGNMMPHSVFPEEAIELGKMLLKVAEEAHAGGN